MSHQNSNKCSQLHMFVLYLITMFYATQATSLQFKQIDFQRMSEGKQLLEYYQAKIDELYKERLAWLSKFEQCSSLLTDKQTFLEQLKQHKDKELDVQRGIVHHDVALLDQKLNVVRMQRDNINHEFMDAEEILKMEELMDEHPQQLEKHLPCRVVTHGGPTIKNQLNIHAASKKAKKANFSIFRENNSVLSSGKGHEESKIKYKPSKEQLLKRQIHELKNNQQREICLLKEQKRKLSELLRTVREKESQTLNDEREVTGQLRGEVKKQEQKYKLLAQKYFNTRKMLKQDQQSTKTEHQRLSSTVASLEQKVNEEMRIYEKENKAKQTLIVRKSQDFQEDYKARMRAKERNLQALRDNYEKMQEVCIEKIQQLEETLTIARHKLNQTENKREQEISQLKSQLFSLERLVGKERAEKARYDEIMRNKIEQDQRARVLLEEKEEEERRKNERSKKILQAYKKPIKTEHQTRQKNTKENRNANKMRPQRLEDGSEEQDSDEQSMNMSELDNINHHIKQIGNKLEKKTR